MRQSIFLYSIITHPRDFNFFHRIIPHAIKHFTAHEIEIKGVKEIHDKEYSDLILQSLMDSIHSHGETHTEKDVKDITSFRFYEIVIESEQEIICKKQEFLDDGLASLFHDLDRTHVGYFFYLENDAFRILNYGYKDEGFFDDSEDEETLRDFIPVQLKANYFKNKWYKEALQ